MPRRGERALIAVPLVEPKRVEKSDRDILKRRIVDKLKKINGTLIAHYYVDGDIQDLAEESGGFVSDSGNWGRFGPLLGQKTATHGGPWVCWGCWWASGWFNHAHALA